MLWGPSPHSRKKHQLQTSSPLSQPPLPLSPVKENERELQLKGTVGLESQDQTWALKAGFAWRSYAVSWSLQFVAVLKQGQTLEGNTLLFPDLSWSLVPYGQLRPCRGTGSQWCFVVVLLPCFRCCQAAFPQRRGKKYSPGNTSLYVAQSPGVLRHPDILGHSSHSQKVPSNTTTGKGEGRQNMRRLAAFNYEIPTETKPLFLKDQSWSYFGFLGF